MKKYLFIVVCILCIVFVLLSLRNRVKKEKMDEIWLATLEALAFPEGGTTDKAESKEETARQEGPYLITIRGEQVYAYRVITVTNCFGVGVVSCTSGINEEWVPVK